MNFKEQANIIYQHLFDPNKPLTEENVRGYLEYRPKEFYKSSMRNIEEYCDYPDTQQGIRLIQQEIFENIDEK